MNTINAVLLIIFIVLVIISGVIVFSQPADNTNNGLPQEQAKLAEKEGVGQYLVDGLGMTLYYFPKDVIGKSNCFGECLIAWPIFYASESSTVQSPLNKADFGTIVGTNGKQQTTYKGWPLYYYFNDKNPGDTLGEGVGDVWYIVPEPFYTVMTQNKNPFGNYLVDSRGMTLYYFTNDVKGGGSVQPKSNCSGQCLVNWPAFNANNIIAPSLLKNSDFSTIQREDGTEQIAYKGWPLYYYIQDKKSGDTLGDGVNGVWFVVKP